MELTAETLSMPGIAVVVLSDVEVLHPAKFDVGPRITRVVKLTVNGRPYTQKFWHNENQKLHHIEGGFDA